MCPSLPNSNMYPSLPCIIHVSPSIPPPPLPPTVHPSLDPIIIMSHPPYHMSHSSLPMYLPQALTCAWVFASLPHAVPLSPMSVLLPWYVCNSHKSIQYPPPSPHTHSHQQRNIMPKTMAGHLVKVALNWKGGQFLLILLLFNVLTIKLVAYYVPFST